MSATRREHDFLGELDIPADVYYGIQTSRALENFKISGTTISTMPRFIQALGYVKKAAAMANMELGVLPESIGRYICLAIKYFFNSLQYIFFTKACIMAAGWPSHLSHLLRTT